MGVVTYPTLEHVAMEARPYPTHVLEGCETGLCLFAAAFLGHNDAIHMAEARLTGTCVDVDEKRLAEMRELYPERWEFIAADAWQYADAAWSLERWWDVVSVDPFTGDAMTRASESIRLWCSLARRAVVLGWRTGTPVTFPDANWSVDSMQRAADIYWLVLRRRD